MTSSCRVKTMAYLDWNSENEEEIGTLSVYSSFILVFTCALWKICVFISADKSSSQTM